MVSLDFVRKFSPTYSVYLASTRPTDDKQDTLETRIKDIEVALEKLQNALAAQDEQRPVK